MYKSDPFPNLLKALTYGGEKTVVTNKCSKELPTSGKELANINGKPGRKIHCVAVDGSFFELKSANQLINLH